MDRVLPGSLAYSAPSIILASRAGRPHATIAVHAEASAPPFGPTGPIEKELVRCAQNGPFGTFADQSCYKDQNKLDNRSKMVHLTRFANQRAGWTKKKSEDAYMCL